MSSSSMFLPRWPHIPDYQTGLQQHLVCHSLLNTTEMASNSIHCARHLHLCSNLRCSSATHSKWCDSRSGCQGCDICRRWFAYMTSHV
jgi:hypothetical protein